MKKFKPMILAALLAGVLLPSQRSQAVVTVPNYELTIPRINAPRIDGDITDLVWTEASQKNGKVIMDLNNTSNFRMQFPRILYVGYDSEAMYFCMINFNPDPAKLTPASGKAFWNGDDLEIYLMPDQTKPNDYVQVGITTSDEFGVINYDQKKRDASLIKVKSTKEDIRWMSEIAIPFKFIGVEPPKAGDKWGFNLAGKASGNVTVGGWMAWNPMNGSFSDTKRFATLTFGK